jgi:hypothetical protein
VNHAISRFLTPQLAFVVTYNNSLILTGVADFSLSLFLSAESCLCLDTVSIHCTFNFRITNLFEVEVKLPPTVSHCVLVSGSPLEPMTSFFFF